MPISVAMFTGFIKRHTAEARKRWGDGWSSAPVGISVLTEEVGKASRCVNKLQLLATTEKADPAVVSQWQRELGHRLVTISSVSQRLAQQFAEEPQEHEYAQNNGGLRQTQAIVGLMRQWPCRGCSTLNRDDRESCRNCGEPR